VSHVEDRWKRGDRSRKRWRARYVDPDGNERARSFDRKIDAERFLAEVEHSKNAGTYRDPDAGNITLRRYAAERLATYHEDSSRRGVIRHQLDRHILPALGGQTLRQLAARPTLVSQFATALPMTPAGAEQVFITLSSILNAAVDDGLITRNPCRAQSVKRPKPRKRKVVPWTAAQVAAVRSLMPARWQAMVDCGSGLGLREGEIFGLGADEVDFLRRNVHVRRQVKRTAGRAWFSAPKGGRERDVPLPETVSMALSAHMAAFPPVAVTLPWHEPGNERRHGKPVTAEVFFTSRRGDQVNPSTYNTTAWRPARLAAGITETGSQDTGTHALRHYYASALLAGGVDIRALSEYLGHHDPGFTLRIYAHLMPSAETRARKAIEAALAEDHGPGTAQEGGNTL
jgi:integrase